VKRPPHNAKIIIHESFEDALASISAAPRKVTVDGRVTFVSRREANLRTLVDRALKGGVSQMTFLLRMLAKNPDLAAPCRRDVVYVFNGYWADL
jgi:hypothetical protein